MNDTYENDIYTADYLDCTHEIDYNLPIRNNQDKTINHQGRKLIEFCLTTDMIIVNGRFGMDGDVGHYTSQRYNGKSTIDYILLSANFNPYISNFHVDVFDKSWSDAHSPICLDLIFENLTRKHMKKIYDSENDNKQDNHLIEYKNYWMSENKE